MNYWHIILISAAVTTVLFYLFGCIIVYALLKLLPDNEEVKRLDPFERVLFVFSSWIVIVFILVEDIIEKDKPATP